MAHHPGAGRYLLGIDLGTSSVKVALTDTAGTVAAAATEPYAVTAPRPGWAETDPADWLRSVARAVRQVGRSLRRGDQVTAVGFSGQMHGLVLTGPDGAPTRPAILHLDTRATAHLDAYRALPGAVLDRLANPLSPNMAGPMLLWAARHEPDAYRGARWALQPKDWLRLRLTGVAASEPSDASATLLYDVPGDRWDADCVARLGLDGDLLAPLLPGGTAPAGQLTAEAAELLGLAAGTPVAAGGGDTAVAAVGSGLVATGPRPGPDHTGSDHTGPDHGADVQVTVGAGGQVLTLLDRPTAHPERGTHLYRTALPSGWYAMGAVLNAGLALDWVRRVLGVGWTELYAAAEAPAGTSDPVFLPHLCGERTPYLDPGMRGAWVGLGLDTGRDAMLRSALEGVAFALRDALDALEALPGSGSGGGTSPVRLAGGGSTAPAWRQLLADTLGRPLQLHEVSDVSARGAALLGGVAAGLVAEADLGGRLAPSLGGLVEPDDAAADAQARRREVFHAAVRALRP